MAKGASSGEDRATAAAQSNPQAVSSKAGIPSAAELEAVFMPRINGAELRSLLTTNPALARRCAACAYTPGTDAYRNPMTSRIRNDCDRTGCPFWCHLKKDRFGFPEHVCRGWLDAQAIEARRSATGPTDAPEPSIETPKGET